MSLVEVVVALAILVGLVGVVVPVLPGLVLVLVAVLVWAVDVGGGTAWTVFGLATAVLVAGTVVKYAVPGRRLKSSGIPASTTWFGIALGVVGFFVIPVVGLIIGFVLGVYLAEHRRVGSAAAWPSTQQALRAVGVSILIELAAGILAALVWVVGVVVT
ncbi:DUF456 domain-containing protein [Nocardioides islandensis]|uniref:DUF456 domain-containing protein n=1 Tax=Nocardioides islandensis TaxID=433663 RepID=A0A930YD68_9ACTN|nr:DUF456 domain-containing protein [Nocardioides islandensis]MBF4763916.1 DUF456 domain-containing protein [Nocardioides islandensis]